MTFGPDNATELAAGVTLMTLDGSKIGNAIIIKEVIPTGSLVQYLAGTGQKLWLIETDFGNQVRCCDNEIHELFGLGYQTDYDRWWDDRLVAIQKGVEG
jgi:hypothetical protein